jgi:hypothetical protein
MSHGIKQTKVTVFNHFYYVLMYCDLKIGMVKKSCFHVVLDLGARSSVRITAVLFINLRFVAQWFYLFRYRCRILEGTLDCESTSTIGRWRNVACDDVGACATRVLNLLLPLIWVVVRPAGATRGTSLPSITWASWNKQERCQRNLSLPEGIITFFECLFKLQWISNWKLFWKHLKKSTELDGMFCIFCYVKNGLG